MSTFALFRLPASMRAAFINLLTRQILSNKGNTMPFNSRITRNTTAQAATIRGGGMDAVKINTINAQPYVRTPRPPRPEELRGLRGVSDNGDRYTIIETVIYKLWGNERDLKARVGSASELARFAINSYRKGSATGDTELVEYAKTLSLKSRQKVSDAIHDLLLLNHDKMIIWQIGYLLEGAGIEDGKLTEAAVPLFAQNGDDLIGVISTLLQIANDIADDQTYFDDALPAVYVSTCAPVLDAPDDGNGPAISLEPFTVWEIGEWEAEAEAEAKAEAAWKAGEAKRKRAALDEHYSSVCAPVLDAPEVTGE